MVAKDGAERQRDFRERRAATHTRLTDMWLLNEVLPLLDDLANYYGIGRASMIEKLVVDRHAAWREGDDAPALPTAMTFKDKRLGYHKPRAVYCTQNNEDCATCSLSSYGMDCHGHPFDYADPDKDD